MHTVIDDLCTGCELCVPVCPVDCIALVAASGERTGWDAWSPAQADAGARAATRATSSASTRRRDAERRDAEHAPSSRQQAVAAALARARAARAGA